MERAGIRKEEREGNRVYDGHLDVSVYIRKEGSQAGDRKGGLGSREELGCPGR